jgi:long chain fatty acid CoA FadD26
MTEISLAALLQERARNERDSAAYTFVDYEVDPNGFAETLTWGQLHQRVEAVAEELRVCGAIGDRAAILAPQGLEYIVSFLGAMQAGFIAVPLSQPMPGVHDDRVSSALRDSLPSVILTTSSAASSVEPYACAEGGRAAPAVIEVDGLDLDSPRGFSPVRSTPSGTAYLQYTSGSTRSPAGVVVTHRNVIVNVDQALTDVIGEVVPQDTVFVSWLPFYHDMGLIKGVCAPLVSGRRGVLMSPWAFLQRPARWMQLLAANGRAVSAAPNFAFELAARRTSDADMAGLDLGGVLGVVSGSERVHAATLKRFTERFSRCGLAESAIRPSYGLAEATVYVATSGRGCAPATARFDYEKLSSGHAKRCQSDVVGSTELIGHGTTRCTTVRIVDPETRTENAAGKVGEIWVHGENVAKGYWRKPKETENSFGATLVRPSAGTPAGPWLKTGDLGVISDGELYIIGRIKDLLIVDGSNHYPDDIEGTVQELTGGRVAAISVSKETTEQLATIVEFKRRNETDDEFAQRLRVVKREVTAAISNAHRLRVADLVFVAPGSLPITTSGKIRRSSCSELYMRGKFERLDVLR